MASWLGCPLIITLSHSETFQIQWDTVEGPMGGGVQTRHNPRAMCSNVGQGGAQKMRGLHRRQPSKSGEPSLAAPPNPPPTATFLPWSI